MRLFQLLLFLFLIHSCGYRYQPSVNELIESDRLFSEMASEVGYGIAFIEFAHPEAVILRKNSMPVTGINQISKLYEKADTAGVKFFWEPLSGNIAFSGDLGYTYGIYTFQKDSIINKGTYVSIWKKDSNGKWKYILDSGNEGLGE
jgi:ketosteroid isomerase-like protein